MDKLRCLKCNENKADFLYIFWFFSRINSFGSFILMYIEEFTNIKLSLDPPTVLRSFLQDVIEKEDVKLIMHLFVAAKKARAYYWGKN